MHYTWKADHYSVEIHGFSCVVFLRVVDDEERWWWTAIGSTKHVSGGCFETADLAMEDCEKQVTGQSYKFIKRD